MNKVHDVLKNPAVAALIRDRVIERFRDGGGLTDEFLDDLARKLDDLKEWKNPLIEAVDGKVWRILLGGAAGILWTLLEAGVVVDRPARKRRTPRPRRAAK